MDRIFAEIIIKCQANGFLGNLSPLVGFFYHKETKIKVFIFTLSWRYVLACCHLRKQI